VQIHLSSSYIGPSSTLAIPTDPVTAATSVQASANLGIERVAHPIPHAPSAMQSFGVGIHVSTSA
jgi:hypothetical protein